MSISELVSPICRLLWKGNGKHFIKEEFRSGGTALSAVESILWGQFGQYEDDFPRTAAGNTSIDSFLLDIATDPMSKADSALMEHRQRI